jgi:transcriptional regulator with XRE-family HTH domain
MTTGHIIRILRAIRHINQPELAYRSHLSQFTISSIETGRRQPTKEHLAALERGLGVNLADPRLDRALQLIQEALQ